MKNRANSNLILQRSTQGLEGPEATPTTIIAEGINSPAEEAHPEQISQSRVEISAADHRPLAAVGGSYALSRPPLPDGPGTIHAGDRQRDGHPQRLDDRLRERICGECTSERTLDCGTAASHKIFGVADWSARLPIALCVLALAVIVFFFGRKLLCLERGRPHAAPLHSTWPGTL